MTIICDKCGEECNQLFMFCTIITSMVGGVAVFGWFTESIGIHMIGMFLGLLFGLCFIYSQNKKHFNHMLKGKIESNLIQPVSKGDYFVRSI